MSSSHTLGRLLVSFQGTGPDNMNVAAVGLPEVDEFGKPIVTQFETEFWESMWYFRDVVEESNAYPHTPLGLWVYEIEVGGSVYDGPEGRECETYVVARDPVMYDHTLHSDFFFSRTYPDLPGISGDLDEDEEEQLQFLHPFND
jgi:hypothetical protein